MLEEQSLRLISVVRAEPRDAMAYIDRDGQLGFSPYEFVGFSDLPHRWLRNIADSPMTSTWYGTQYLDGSVAWSKESTHRNKRNGACDCSNNDCRKLGICDPKAAQSINGNVEKRLAFLTLVATRREKAREANRRSKAKREEAKGG